MIAPLSDERLAILVQDCRVLAKLHPDTRVGPGPVGWR